MKSIKCGVATCLLSMLFAGCNDDVVSAVPRLKAVDVRVNGDLTPGIPVRYEDPTLARLKELREREKLDSIVDPRRREFENILAIKDWVAAQWPHSTPDPYPPWDAITILDWIRSGKTGGYCGQYSQVMLQALASFGIVARYVEIGSTTNPYAHFVVEVWSNDFNKWAMMDADFNVHFARKGVPMSALDLHEALMQGKTDEIDSVLGASRVGHDDPHIYPLRTMEFYYYVRTLLKANHLSVPDEPDFDRVNDTVEWLGGGVVPWDQSTVESVYPKELLSTQVTSDPVNFAPKLNQVRVTVKSSSETETQLEFVNNSRDHVTYQIIEHKFEKGRLRNFWIRSDSPTFTWAPSPGSTLRIQSVDSHGHAGPAAVVAPTFQ